MAQASGIIHVLVSGEATENRLTQQTDKRMAAVLARASIGEGIACNHRQAEHVIEFAIGQQSGIRGHHRAAKLEHQAAVEIEPENPIVRFTRWTGACADCSIKRQCTTGKERRIKRWEHEAVVDAMQQRLDRAPDTMRIRRQTVEHPFGTLKAWMGATHFLTKTLTGS